MSCTALFAQEARVTVEADNITIEQLLSIIESQTNKTFAYTADVFNPTNIISVDASNQSVT